MATRYKASYCDRLVNNYIEEIEKQKISMRKNFEDMDLENADIRGEFEDIIDEMQRACDNLIREINCFNFY